MPNTTMNSLRNSITEMGARIREAASALAVAANDESISMEEVQRQQAALRAMNERMNALQASYNAQYDENAGTLPTPPAMSASDAICWGVTNTPAPLRAPSAPVCVRAAAPAASRTKSSLTR